MFSDDNDDDILSLTTMSNPNLEGISFPSQFGYSIPSTHPSRVLQPQNNNEVMIIDYHVFPLAKDYSPIEELIGQSLFGLHLIILRFSSSPFPF